MNDFSKVQHPPPAPHHATQSRRFCATALRHAFVEPGRPAAVDNSMLAHVPGLNDFVAGGMKRLQ
jgi:hypothetical protein